MKIRYHSIVPCSHVDGPGDRVVLFLQGCSIRCPGCQSPHLWDNAGGHEVDPAALTDQLLAFTSDPARVTISGGEPTDQPHALLSLLIRLHYLSPDLHIVLYSGRTLPEIRAHLGETLAWRILLLVNVLVDGPYIADLDDAHMQHRGSRNQRVINIPATLDAGEIVLLDWDAPEIIITATGQVSAAVGLAEDLDLADLGKSSPGRICGAPPEEITFQPASKNWGEPWDWVTIEAVYLFSQSSEGDLLMIADLEDESETCPDTD